MVKQVVRDEDQRIVGVRENRPPFQPALLIAEGQLARRLKTVPLHGEARAEAARAQTAFYAATLRYADAPSRAKIEAVLKEADAAWASRPNERAPTSSAG